MNKLIAIAVVALSLGSGCAVRVARPTGRPLPPPAPAPAPMVQRMTYEEAVNRAMAYAQSRGFATREVKEAHLNGRDIWKVKLEVASAHSRGKLHVELDAFSRDIVRAQEHLKHRKHKHDDDDHDRGRGHTYGHGDDDDVHEASAVADARGAKGKGRGHSKR